MRDLLAFPDTSRVWIYQAHRSLPESEIGMINDRIARFAKEWTSHNKQLRATGGLLHDTFLVLVADESQAGASGCSIDASVRFVRQLGLDYDVDFFDRLTFTYLSNGEVRRVHRDDLAAGYASGAISDNTLFFDNLVRDKGEYLSRWLRPLRDTWIRRFV